MSESELSRLLREAAANENNTAYKPPTRLDATSSVEELFSDEPILLTEFITSPLYLNNFRLSDVQFDAVRHLTHIFYDGWVPDPVTGIKEYYPERDLYKKMGGAFDPHWAEPIRMINHATLQWG